MSGVHPYPEDLYDGSPPASNPSTSRAAAEAIAEGSANLRERVWRALAERPQTDEELQDGLDMPPSTERPRRRELVLLGRVRETALRRLTRSGRRAIVWEVVKREPIRGPQGPQEELVWEG